MNAKHFDLMISEPFLTQLKTYIKLIYLKLLNKSKSPK